MRAQATLESLVVLTASAMFLAILAPSYKSAFKISFLARQESAAMSAAETLSSAVGFVQAGGEGSESSGAVLIPSQASVVSQGDWLALRVTESGNAVDYPIGSGCQLLGGCSGNCSFRAYHDPGGCYLDLH